MFWQLLGSLCMYIGAISPYSDPDGGEKGRANGYSFRVTAECVVRSLCFYRVGNCGLIIGDGLRRLCRRWVSMLLLWTPGRGLGEA